MFFPLQFLIIRFNDKTTNQMFGIFKSPGRHYLMGDFPTLGGSRLTGQISIVYVVLNMRIILRTMTLPGKSAATYSPRKSLMTIKFHIILISIFITC